MHRSIVNRTLEIEETAAWRNGCIVHTWLTFLTFSSALCLFKLILPNNVSDRSLLKAIYVFKFSFVDAQLTHQTWKEKRNPQACYWIRASQQLKVRGVCSLSSPLLFKKFLVPYCSFVLLKTPWRTEISATKTFNHVQLVFNSSENWSKVISTNFRDTLLQTANFVCCQHDI